MKLLYGSFDSSLTVTNVCALILEVDKKTFCLGKKDKLYWLRNDLNHFHFKDEKILWSHLVWLHDCIMDEAQKLIFKEIRVDDDYLSVLNVQKRLGTPYGAAKTEHI